MKKYLIVKQDGYKECGAASLLSIIRYYKGNISINRLIELTHTDKTGTNFYYLKEASEQIGLEALGYKVDHYEDLLSLNKPFICQLVDKNYEHFVVIYRLQSKKVVMMDPAVGEKIISKEEFENLWTGYILIFSPIKRLLFYQEKKYLNQVIIETIRKNKCIVLNILLLSIIFTIGSCIYTLYFQLVLDHVISSTKNNLLIVTFFFSMLLVIKCIANFFRTELLIYFNQKLDCSIFLKTFQKILLLPYSYYKNRTTGEIVSRINDLIYVKNILNKMILTVFLDLIVLLCCSILLIKMNFYLFVFLVLIILIYLLLFYIFRPVLKKFTEKNQQNSALINSYLIESINGYETIKNLSVENQIMREMEKLYVEALNDNFIYENISNLEIFMKDFISLLGLLLVEFLGFSMVMNHCFTIGEFLTFTLLASCLIEPIKNIIDLNKEYYYALSSLQRVNHLLDINTEDLSTKTQYEIQGNIRFYHLSFGYRKQNNILKDIDLEVGVGDKVLILGDSGCGKSTLMKLLLKYYPVDRNMIYVDDVDLNDYSLQNIRNSISCVFQNEILYTDTIKRNIIFNRMVSDEDFIEVCKISGVDEFVKKLFLGYETKLEENGLNLSGGQRQRIILARMLLKSSKIMLIDEGLDAIDVASERKVLQNIFKRYSKKTIIVISHRRENLDLFEKVVYLKEGSVIEKNNYSNRTLYD